MSLPRFPIPVVASLILILGGMPANAAEDVPKGLAGTTNTVIESVPFEPAAWELVWAEEFDVPGVPNPANWSHEIGYIRNNERQFYTDQSRNARVEDGRLIIEAHLDGKFERGISSASLHTKGKQEFHLGRIEARARVPTGKGTWPAIWTLGTNIGEVSWPECGELDILEYVGYDPMTVHANVHTGTYNHKNKNGRGNRITTAREPWLHFNVFAVEWYENRVEFFFNDQRYLVVNRQPGDDVGAWPFDAPQYLIVNLAIGGAWGGQKGVDESLFPHRYEIDYIRYYSRKSAADQESG